MSNERQINDYHIRYPYTGSLIGHSCSMGPTQHAVDNKTLKTLCGKDASNWGVIDEKENAPVNCERCKRKIALLENDNAKS